MPVVQGAGSNRDQRAWDKRDRQPENIDSLSIRVNSIHAHRGKVFRLVRDQARPTKLENVFEMTMISIRTSSFPRFIIFGFQSRHSFRH